MDRIVDCWDSMIHMCAISARLYSATFAQVRKKFAGVVKILYDDRKANRDEKFTILNI